MILIDQNTENVFQNMLEGLRGSQSSLRCIYLKTSPDFKSSKQLILAIVQQSEKLSTAQEKFLYSFDDGDIAIITHGVVAKELEAFSKWIIEQEFKKVSEQQIYLYEIPQQLGKLILIAEEKVEKKRNLNNSVKKEAEEKRQQSKRENILNYQTEENIASKIAELRAKHKTPEIMFIEDDNFSRKLIESALKKDGNLTLLPDAITAIASYIHKAPNIVFLDINLPDVSGLELLEKFVAIDPEAYVVMLSGNSQKENVMLAVSKGAKGFVGKPFTRDKLLHYIKLCPTMPKQF